MTAFADLKFEKTEEWQRAHIFFPNGYGVSVIISPWSYGGREGLYELGVISGSEGHWTLDYSTPITDDVIGHLTPAEVTRLMEQVEALPQKCVP